MTNEEYIKAIDERTSRRTYRAQAMSEQTISVIRDMVEYVNEQADLYFHFMEDGTAPFKLFTGKFSLIAICGPDTEAARVKCGYYGETIILQCAYHGLGTCWATGTYNENKVYELLNLPKDIRIYGVITIGLVKPQKSMKEKTMYNATHTTSKPYQKMFEVCDKKLPPYYEFAMKQVEKAPSATNRRPVKFRYENGIISAKVDEPYSDMSIDFGIAQLHFQLGAAEKGIKGEWNFRGEFIPSDEKVIKFPERAAGENDD